jgi:hypothetical protein
MGDFNEYEQRLDCHPSFKSKHTAISSTFPTQSSSYLPNSKPFECQVCFKKFSSKQNKREHIRLKHTYSSGQKHIPLISQNKKTSDLLIPKLSTLVLSSSDPDIRPFTRIQKIYLFSDLFESSELSEISETRKSFKELPPLKAIVN